MTRRELINMVKTKVDELSPADSRVISAMVVSESPVDLFADSLLDECGREVLMRAPMHRLPGCEGGREVFSENDGCGYVVLPSDFLRLLEFRMSGWERSVVSVVESGSALALKQSNSYLRGGRCKPVCVFGHCDGARVLEYYGVGGSGVVERFTYVRDVAAEDIPVDLQDVLTWWCASRILEIVGKSGDAKTAYERGGSLL